MKREEPTGAEKACDTSQSTINNNEVNPQYRQLVFIIFVFLVTSICAVQLRQLYWGTASKRDIICPVEENLILI